MDMLDETVGAENWERTHSRDNANCTVSIYDKDKQMWIHKEDTGTESNTEKEKGLASDSFKRACVNWGIGRELYTSPKMIIWGNPEELKYKEFSVKEIEYNEKREITLLVIVDEKGNVVFSTKGNVVNSVKNDDVKVPVENSKKSEEKLITDAQRKRLFAISSGNNDVIRDVLQKYGYDKTEQIKMSEYNNICKEIEDFINTF